MTDNQPLSHPTSVMATHGVPEDTFKMINKHLPTDSTEKIQRAVTILAMAGVTYGSLHLATCVVRRSGIKTALLASSLAAGSLITVYLAGSEAGWRRRDRVAAIYHDLIVPLDQEQV